MTKEKQSSLHDINFAFGIELTLVIRATLHAKRSDGELFRFWDKLRDITLQRCIQNPVTHLKDEAFSEIINGQKPFTIFVKHSILDVWQRSDYTSASNPQDICIDFIFCSK